MNELKKILAKPKEGHEFLVYNDKKTTYNLLDFWRWSVSDILSNSTRGIFAEFIVGTAIGLHSSQTRNEWDAFDLITDYGIKIEVKSAAYIQSWSQRKYSNILFSIKKARYWDADTNIYSGDPQRHSDVYVFCHLKHKDQNTIDPLKLEQWDFFIVPTYKINSLNRNAISLPTLINLAPRSTYENIRKAINSAYQDQQNHTRRPQ